MFPTRILLADDGSEDAQHAVKTAIALSTKLESEVHVIYVSPEHPYLHAHYDLRHREEEQRLRKEDQRKLDEYVDHIREAGGIVAQAYLKMGEAAKQIVELAEELRVDLVVLGSRGHATLRRALMGSVSTSMLRHAHCSVLIVRSPEQEQRRSLLLGKIVVATDGSEEASFAAQAATEIAKATGGSEARPLPGNGGASGEGTFSRTRSGLPDLKRLAEVLTLCGTHIRLSARTNG